MRRMPKRVPDEVRSEAIRRWLKGESRDKISSDMGLAGGSVTNIIDEWKQGLSIPTSEHMRELAVQFKKLGITAAEASAGGRIINIMKNLHVDDERVESFVRDIYDACTNNSLSPEKFVELASLLSHLSTSWGIPLLDVPRHIEDKTRERKGLENEIKKMQAQKESLEREVKQTLQNKEVTLDTLDEFTHTSDELKKHKLSVEDIPRLVNCLNNAKEGSFDTAKIVERISNFESLKAQQKEISVQIKLAQDEERKIKEGCVILEQELNKHQQSLALYADLRSIGFGVKGLKILHDMVLEIADANDIPANEAIKKFIGHVKEQYDKTLGFEFSLQEITTNIEKGKQELNELEVRNASRKGVINSLERLLSEGTKEDDILHWSSIIKKHGIDINSLDSSLDQYGSLSKCIDEKRQELRNLEKQEGLIRTSVDTLTKRKEELDVSFKVSKESLMKTIDEALAKVLEVSLEFGALEALKPLVKLIGEGKGDKHQVYPAMYSVLKSFKSWQEASGGNSFIHSSTDSLMNSIEQMMSGHV